ncbi:serine protease inhibitor 77Ba-like [Maniola hyperantus]|uniref:serine protease inhibitor 77Ba-like n=1 Tax=Aphantopus hyperantus TaxID=2795564 RepID=UPI001567FE8A|nr:serine protease inhibitor 2.1-like [Maniola hyperantus]
MKCITFFIFTIASCYANIEFSARPRNFSIELLYHTQRETDGHVVISPFGIWSLMAGVALGTSGSSRTELTRAFILPPDQNEIINGYANLTKTVLDPSTKGVTLSTRNFLFLDNGFNIFDDYRRTLTTDFGAMIKNLDFKDPASAARIANTLIEDSGASVSNVLRSDDFAESKMILTNVISFKGLWSSPFNTSETTVESFYDENKNVLGKVNMMYQRAPLPYSHIKDMRAFVLQLSYGNDGKYCMLIILPYPKVKVTEVYSKFATISFKDIFDKIDYDIKEFGLEDVDVKLPRFKISTNLVLNKPLNQMGVYDIFNSKKANFQRITKEEIYISAIVHKADIEVTESGTVASASTSAFFADRISTPNFEANRPFIYFVMEKSTSTVIFSGIYSKPSVF